jgi:hypothetical protein
MELTVDMRKGKKTNAAQESELQSSQGAIIQDF